MTSTVRRRFFRCHSVPVPFFNAQQGNPEMKQPTDAAKPQPKRRWYQYSLLALLTAVTLAGCGLGWFGWKVRQASAQAAAVAAIEKLGGNVQYDYQFNSRGEMMASPELPGPAWLHALLGGDFFRNVRVVDLSGKPATDGDLERLKDLTKLGRLVLSGTQITDGGLKQLPGLTHLKSLALAETQITDAGLPSLRGLAQLESLELDYTKVTDAGLASLRRLTQLGVLTLTGTQVTDAGLPQLTSLTHSNC